jgi:hypothetical protein
MPALMGFGKGLLFQRLALIEAEQPAPIGPLRHAVWRWNGRHASACCRPTGHEYVAA